MKKNLKSVFVIFLIFLLFTGCSNISIPSPYINQKSASSSTESSELSETFSSTYKENSENSKDSKNSEISVISEISENSENILDTSFVYDLDKKYFVNQLDNRMFKNFIGVYKAAMQFENSAEFKEPITSNELDIIMYLLNYECPEIMQISGSYYPEYTDEYCTDVSAVSFDYIMEEGEYNKALEQVNDFLNDMKKQLDGKSDFEKEKYVYDYIVDNCIYNDQEKFTGSVYGILAEKRGRCEAISKTFEWCMREMDIECMIVVGVPLWDNTSAYSSHSWNIVKINGEYYGVDITIDNIRFSEDDDKYILYGFYNVDEDMMNRTRVPNMLYNNLLSIPRCESLDENYHIRNNQYIGDSNDIKYSLAKILNDKFDGKTEMISIRFKNQEDYNMTIDNIDQWITDIMLEIADMQYNYKTYYDDLSYSIVFDIKVV